MTFTDRDRAVRAAVEQGLVGPETEPARRAARHHRDPLGGRLHAAFAEVTAPGTPVLHTFAVKAASLVPVLRLLPTRGSAARWPAPGSWRWPAPPGCRPTRTVLDSPAKTAAELREALALGIAVNADNPQELDRLDALVAGRPPSRSPLGPAGQPAGRRRHHRRAVSTATATSKFGVALRDEGAREWVVRAYLDRPWLTRLHAHAGSQGMPAGADGRGRRGPRTSWPRRSTRRPAAGRSTPSTSAAACRSNFASDETRPTFARVRAAAARRPCPGCFDGRYGLVTEFGRSLLAKNGLVLARVEYAKSAGGRPIAVTHAGAQVATRTVFAPESWPLRVAAYDAKGRPKSGPRRWPRTSRARAASRATWWPRTGRCRCWPRAIWSALLDTGAYYFSEHFAYNSLPRAGRPRLSAGAGRRRALRRAGDPADGGRRSSAESGGAHAKRSRALTGL